MPSSTVANTMKTKTKPMTNRISTNKLEAAKSALRIIHTWSTYRNGEELDCREVAKLCEKTLRKTK
jgi:hypothetical protein